MSRVAKKPVDLPQGVSATIGADAVTVKGSKGSLTLAIKSGIKVELKDKHLAVEAESAAEGLNAIAGSTRAHLANMVTGVTKGYEKKLHIEGVGFKAEVSGSTLSLNIGYTHIIKFPIPAGIKIAVEKNVDLTVSGTDKEVVGQTAATIRAYRKPDVYKGKGIMYLGEKLRKKVGKAGATA